MTTVGAIDINDMDTFSNFGNTLWLSAFTNYTYCLRRGWYQCVRWLLKPRYYPLVVRLDILNLLSQAKLIYMHLALTFSAQRLVVTMSIRVGHLLQRLVSASWVKKQYGWPNTVVSGLVAYLIALDGNKSPIEMKAHIRHLASRGQPLHYNPSTASLMSCRLR